MLKTTVKKLEKYDIDSGVSSPGLSIGSPGRGQRLVREGKMLLNVRDLLLRKAGQGLPGSIDCYTHSLPPACAFTSEGHSQQVLMLQKTLLSAHKYEFSESVYFQI